jgi:tetratricopeptide (TPR) repeat protein
MAKLDPASGISWGIAATNVAVMVVTWHVAVAIHELAHALAGRCLGCRVALIDLGSGRPTVKRAIAGTTVVLHPWPMSGRTLIVLRSTAYAKLRLALVFAAGPLASAGLAWACLQHSTPWDLVMGAARTRSVGFELLFVFATLASASLIPLPSVAGAPPSDGWQLLALPGRKIDATEVANGADLVDGIVAALDRRWADVHRSASRVLERTPDHLTAMVVLADATLLQGDLVTALDLHTALLQRLQATPGSPLLPLVRNNLAWNHWLSHDPARLADAMTLSEQALSARPDIASLQGTRGAVLLEAGRSAEAISLLERARKGSDRYGRAHHDCCLAVARSRSGDLRRARHHLEAAARADAGCTTLEWARAEVAAAARTGPPAVDRTPGRRPTG